MSQPQRRFPAPVDSLDSDGQVYDLEGDLLPRRYRFDPSDAASLSRVDSDAVRFRLVTEPDIVEARVTIRRPEQVASRVMGLELDGSELRIWTVTSQVEDGDEYSLAFLDDRARPVYLTRAGMAGSVERLDRWRIELDAIPVIDVPFWARGAVMYQIFPDRFANGDPGNDPENPEPWDSAPTRTGFKGGDLDGIIDHLDHLAGMGVDVIYLNPVVTSPSNHRYDASDFHHVDPILGGDEAFDRLRAATRERGIRLVVDLSLNHCHPTHEAFADVRERGEESPHWSWFQVAEWPIQVRYRPRFRPKRFAHFEEEDAVALEAQTGIPLVRVEDEGRFLEPTYDSWYSVPTMPRFDLTDPAAREYLLGVARHWITRFASDGIRMDVARYVEPDFWREARQVIRGSNEDAYLLCEIFGEAAAWLQGDSFDGTMNYVARRLLLGFCSGEIDGGEWLRGVERMVASVTPEALQASQLLLGSHDTPRFLTEVCGHRWRLELATLLQFTLPGLPSLYYGDEVYMEGGGDPACRGAFPWGTEGRSPLVDAIRDLSALRKAHPALRIGDWQPVGAGADWVSFSRELGDDQLLVVANRSEDPVTIEAVGLALTWGSAFVSGDGVSVDPHGGAILASVK